MQEARIRIDLQKVEKPEVDATAPERRDYPLKYPCANTKIEQTAPGGSQSSVLCPLPEMEACDQFNILSCAVAILKCSAPSVSL
jgi:hypothetical protein